MIRVIVRDQSNKIIVCEDTDSDDYVSRIERYHNYHGNKVSITRNL